MSLGLRVELPCGRYDAGAEDPRLAEWPPHPGRVHCALLAGARTATAGAALRWLEQQPPPQVWAEPAPVGSTRWAGFVPTNRIEVGGPSQFHLARGSQLRRRAGSTIRTCGFAIVWPGAHAAPEHLAALDGLARRVPYLGRSEGVAVVAVIDGQIPLDPGWCCHEAVEGPGEFDLRVAFPGYTDTLEQVSTDGGRAWEVSYRIGYRCVRQEPAVAAPPSELRSPYDDVLTYALPPGTHLAGLQAGLVTSQLRTVVMGLVGRAHDGALPVALSGHGADGRPHVAFMPLLDVGHPHAGGYLLGVGIACPRDLPEVRAAVLAGLRAAPLTLRLPFGEVTLNPAAERLVRASNPNRSRLSPAYWAGPSTRWASATPVVLDHFPKRRDELGSELARSCVRGGLPQPCEVMVGGGPMLSGGAAMRRRHLARREDRPRLFTHCVLTFPAPVRGPVLLGAQRHLGIGLFAPIGPAAPAAEARGA